MKVKNMINNKGNSVQNQFVIEDGDKKIFQSYNSTIVLIKNGKVFLDKNFWNYSKTTSKYRNLFLNEDTEATKNKIKKGVYRLANLNK